MGNNRQILASEIVNRFVDEISGNGKERIMYNNPNDCIYVGKLSPQSASDAISSNVMVKQISIDFKLKREEISQAELEIFPQGYFYYRILPTLEEQRAFYLKEFNVALGNTVSFASVEEMLRAYKDGKLTDEMKTYKVQLLPIYERISIECEQGLDIQLKQIYNERFDCGSIPQESQFYSDLQDRLNVLCDKVKNNDRCLVCMFRDKIVMDDLISEESWQKYVKKQIAREEFQMYPRFSYSLSVELKGDGDTIDVTVALSNETQYGDETTGFGQPLAKEDAYRINTLFNSGIKVKCNNANFVPIELDYFANDYKYDKNIYGLGNNCNVKYNDSEGVLETVHVPLFIQNRLKTNDSMAVKFSDLVEDPVGTLNEVYNKMLGELNGWERDFVTREGLTPIGKKQFKNEIENFKFEIKRFKTGVELIEQYYMIRMAFKYMNSAFMNSAKGYDSWRLFQIVFVVSLILDVVAHEPELMLDESTVSKAKTDKVDILYFPTGGGKTEAFLGILVFNLFFDRLRGKEYGMTALLKYPLRLLSVQQVQRVANILAVAEKIRINEGLGGDRFSLGYYVGDKNTPNKIDKELIKTLNELTPDEMDEKYRLLDVCPYCGKKGVHVVYDAESNSLRHKCENEDCQSGGELPLYMVDDDIYRYIPSVVISTVDKLTAIGLNMRFHNLICGAEYLCPKHGFTARNSCLVKECTCETSQFKRIKMKDPAPTLLIQDELHLIKESLGAYDAHYETFIEYFIRELSGCNRGIKVIGATATISAYSEQAWHLYWKNAIRFPAESPYLDRNFYSFIDKEDIGRIIIGYAPFGKAIVNSVAYSLQYLKKVVYNMYLHPEEVLNIPEMSFEGTDEEKITAVKRLLEDYWIILEYNNVKQESNRVLQALEDPINTELIAKGIEPLTAKKMTGDDTFQEVRATLSSIEHADSTINDLDFNMIAATSMISHGVDADRFNLMLFFGMPGNTAEYIQAYSRVGRKHTGVVIDIMRPSREKDKSYLKNFVKFHEYKDILVDSVAINRWATKAVESTLPGIVTGLLLNYYLYKLQNTAGMKDISKYGDLKNALSTETIKLSELKKHAYAIYKCSDDDSSIGMLYRQKIDEMLDNMVDALVHGSFDAKSYLTGVFDRCHYHVMSSLRDTDKQIIVEMK